MKCEKCYYTTENKKSFSNHLRYGCKTKSLLKNCLQCRNLLPRNIKPKDGRKFCNHVCYGLYKSGHKRGVRATNYIHGKCGENLLFRASKEYKYWRKLVFKRDAYCCVKCGISKNLEADHIKPFSLYPELRLDINNGRTLCKSCHKKQKLMAIKTKREIKFRFWLGLTNKMTYVHSLFDIGHLFQDRVSYDAIPMQYTGRKDKNEKEIYEGDVLKSFHFQDRNGTYYLYHKIVWDGEYSAWKAVSINNTDGESATVNGNPLLFVYLKCSNNNHEIIGNIYETPNLIS